MTTIKPKIEHNPIYDLFTNLFTESHKPPDFKHLRRKNLFNPNSNCTLQGMNKLKVGSIILVHGWIMTKGLDGGCKYRVESIPDYRGMPTYQFTKAKGKNVVARHYAGDIEVWIKEKDHPDLNRIEVIEL